MGWDDEGDREISGYMGRSLYSPTTETQVYTCSIRQYLKFDYEQKYRTSILLQTE